MKKVKINIRKSFSEWAKDLSEDDINSHLVNVANQQKNESMPISPNRNTLRPMPIKRSKRIMKADKRSQD